MIMDKENFELLKPNQRNPRIIKDKQFRDLKESLKLYGDLSGIVRNIRTDRLVGGNQRTEAFKTFPGEKPIVITHRFDAPNPQGTVAVGYVDINGELFSYREVDWPDSKEIAANVAANHMGGEDDRDLLAEVTYELSQMEDAREYIGLMGLSDREINGLIKSVSGDEELADAQGNDDGDKFEFAVTAGQRAIIEQAIERIKLHNDLLAIGGPSQNGAAIFLLCRDYLDKHNDSRPQGDLTNLPE